MRSSERHRRWWVAWFVVVLAAAGGPVSAQQRSAAPPGQSVTSPSLPAGDGAAPLRAALASLPDVGGEDHAVVSFVDHAAVRAGGASTHAWFGRLVPIGVVGFDFVPDIEAVTAATGVALPDVVTTIAVDASVPSYLTLVQGGVDAERLDAVLLARGYAAVEDDRARRWCGPHGCDGGFQVDFARRDDLAVLFGGGFGRSFPAVLAGDLLAVGPMPEALDATLDVATGAAPSLLGRPEVEALVDALDVDAVVRQVWMPFGAYLEPVAPQEARSVLLADARRGGDEWLLVLVAFERPAAADAFAAGALVALGLTGPAEFGPATVQAALRARATDAVVDTVAHAGLTVVRIAVARAFSDGVGTAQDRPADLFRVMLNGVARREVPWAVR